MPEAPAQPAVTIVVAARNAERTLAACLTSLLAIDYPRVEIVVADDGSTDRTASLAASFGVRVLELEPCGPSAARNRAVQDTRGDLVAFTDADCTVDPDWLRVLVDALERTGAASAGGPQQNVFEADAVAGRELDAFFRVAAVLSDYARADDRGRFVDHNASCNSIYRREAFVAAGGFPEGLWPGEDVELDWQLRAGGRRCFYVPAARVRHHRPSDPAWFAAMMRRYGSAQRELVRRHGFFRPLHYVPLALTAIATVQGGLLHRRLRPAVFVLDATMAAVAMSTVAAAVPIELWAGVARLMAVAAVEWNRGFLMDRSTVAPRA